MKKHTELEINEELSTIVNEFLEDIQPVDLDDIFADEDFEKIKLIIKYELERWEQILLALDCMNYGCTSIAQITGINYVTIWKAIKKIKEKIKFFDDSFTYKAYIAKIHK